MLILDNDCTWCLYLAIAKFFSRFKYLIYIFCWNQLCS
jgi:hypothetical protein